MIIIHEWASLVAQTVKCLPVMQETWVQSLGREDPLEKETATHSSILARKIPWTEEPHRLQSVGCKESDTTEWLYLSWMVAENTHPLSEFLLLFPFSLPWRGTEKEVLGQSIITLAFSAASSTSPFYHLFYNLRRLFTFRLFHFLNSISWVFYPTMNFSTPQWTFPPHDEFFSSFPPKHSMQLQTLCKMFFLLRRLFSTLIYQSLTSPLVQISLTFKYTSISLLSFSPICTPLAPCSQFA